MPANSTSCQQVLLAFTKCSKLNIWLKTCLKCCNSITSQRFHTQDIAAETQACEKLGPMKDFNLRFVFVNRYVTKFFT